MSATRRSLRERGTALVAVMMFATTVSALCLFTLTSSSHTYVNARRRLENTKAFYVGEAGVDFLMGNLTQDGYWPARSTSMFPTANSDGSFTSNWISMGASGGEFRITCSYQRYNPVPSSWTGNGFPEGYEPFSNVVLSDRSTSSPSFSRLYAAVTGRYNGVTRTIKTGIRWRTTLYGAAIVSDAAPISGGGAGKSFGISNDVIVLDTARNYIHGGIMANNTVYVRMSSQPLVEATASTQIGGAFTGALRQNLYGTDQEIPDFTNPGASAQLFDFNRFRAAAAAGAGAVYPSLSSFAAAMRAANAAGTKLQGIIYVTVDAAVEGNNPHITTDTSGTGVGPLGINIDGTMVFHFVNTTDRFYKVFGEAPLHINAAPLDGTFDPADPTTFKTGYPPALPEDKKACNVDISGAGFQNFSADDDLPALMFDNGTVDIHHETNICGAMYSPSFMEIENKEDALQFFNGTIISGGGVYFESGNSSGAQVVNFDSATVDSLPTFDLRGQSPQIANYAVGE